MRTRTFLTVLAACSFAALAQAGAPSGAIVASDLQHHRWILESINGEALALDDGDSMIPELDFGEQMHVSGNTGCNQMSGTAELRDGIFRAPNLATTRRMCSPERNQLEMTMLTVLGSESVISIDEDRNLILSSGDVVLQFRLRDWVN